MFLTRNNASQAAICNYCAEADPLHHVSYPKKLFFLQAQFEAAMQSKTVLEADAAATQRRMDSANALLSALSGEEGRWTQQSSVFDATIQKLTGAYLRP